MSDTKFKISIERVSRETYQMELPGNSLMDALDIAREMATNRTKKSTPGTNYFITKIEEIKK